MASISRDRNGRRDIRFVRSDGTRPKIRLGKVTQKQAEAVKVHVERLIASTITGHVVDDETARWVAGPSRAAGALQENGRHRDTELRSSIDNMANENQPDRWLKPVDIKRIAGVPYKTVVAWLTSGHSRAGVLPSVDLANDGKRHSYRVRPDDWQQFQERLRTRQSSAPDRSPTAVIRKRQKTGPGNFRY